MRISILVLALLVVASVNAAIINFNQNTPISGSGFTVFPRPNFLPQLPYSVRWNGTGVFDNVRNNATLYMNIFDGSGGYRGTAPLYVNVSSDTFDTIYDKEQALMWNQYLIDAGNAQNALQYFFTSQYYYDVGACMAR